MFTRFFAELRAAKVPVSVREYLDLLAGLDAGLALHDAEAFYFLARTSLVKDERHVDRFDRVFGRRSSPASKARPSPRSPTRSTCRTTGCEGSPTST